ncbi:MAG: phosphatidylglycerol lysyltransferase domain-containing protein [Marinovum sp.]|nr:phosphatidylglycerol lysyltransferase domain-containing protein [Marinovum sp.]
MSFQDQFVGGRAMTGLIKFVAPLRHVVPLALGSACLWLLWKQVSLVDIPTVWSAVKEVSIVQWGLALAATWISFWALGKYDVHMHAHCRTGVAPVHAARSGMIAIAIGQTTGVTAVVSGFLRWRLLRPLGVAPVAGVTAAISVFFLLGWAVILGLSALLPGSPVPMWLFGLASAGLLSILALSVLRPPLPGTTTSIPVPSAVHVVRIFSCSIVEMVGAAFAFFVLLPSGADVAFLFVVPVFIFAFGAGLYSGTPGGVGAFELTLLGMLPTVSEPDLLATVLAFRVIYFGLPTALALAALVWDHTQGPPPKRKPLKRPHLPLSQARQAEAALVRSNGGFCANAAGTQWVCVDTGQSHVFMLDPLMGCVPTALPLLRQRAWDMGRLALLYKVSEDTAIQARQSRWSVTRIAEEAVLNPAAFDIADRSRRQLRRKLRQAETMGIVIRPVMVALEYPALEAIANAWRQQHGRERGVSMGRFSKAAVENQYVLGAYQNGLLRAFASFHTSEDEMCLDLMRQTVDCPAGTMHSLVYSAIEEAKRIYVPRVSLAAAPVELEIPKHNYLRRALAKAARWSNGAGLRQFKDSFGPKWEPRYAAAPNSLTLVLGLLDMARAVHWPDRIVAPHESASYLP